MAQSDLGTSGPATNRGRLNGWKEIANYLGKSVRTAIRWEQELGLPVHRFHTAGGEIIYAFREQIDQWQAENEKAGTAPQPGTRNAARFTGRLLLALALLAAVAGIAGAVAWRARSGSRQPANWRVENNTLKISDSAGKPLWEYTFQFPLHEPAYRRNAPRPPSSLAAIDDWDNDGRKEVLFFAHATEPSPAALYCFNSNGSVRFTRGSAQDPMKTVQFGATRYESPYIANQFLLASASNAEKTAWLVMLHNLWFPSVLQKVGSGGNILAEYWSNGHITSLKEAEIGGRQYLLVGATNNEHYGASLAVLDYDSPSGSAPAAKADYGCLNCPPGEPVAFLVFPRMEPSRELSDRPHVSEIRVKPNGELTVSVLQAQRNAFYNADQLDFPVFYTLNSRFQVIAAEIGDAYRHSHARLEMRGRFKHRFNHGCERELFPVLAWDGRQFVKVHPPGNRE
jgi:hypothetical protein